MQDKVVCSIKPSNFRTKLGVPEVTCFCILRLTLEYEIPLLGRVDRTGLSQTHAKYHMRNGKMLIRLGSGGTEYNRLSMQIDYHTAAGFGKGIARTAAHR